MFAVVKLAAISPERILAKLLLQAGVEPLLQLTALPVTAAALPPVPQVAVEALSH